MIHAVLVATQARGGKMVPPPDYYAILPPLGWYNVRCVEIEISWIKILGSKMPLGLTKSVE